MAVDDQNLLAQTRISNAASPSVTLQRRQSKQFGFHVNVFAQSNNILAEQPETALLLPLTNAPLTMDLLLLVALSDTHVHASASASNNTTSKESPAPITDVSASPAPRTTVETTDDHV